MKKTTKLIAMLTMIAMLTGVLAVAVADDKIYTSPVFVIPLDRVDTEIPEEEPEVTEPEEADEAEPEEAAEPAEDTETTEAEQPEETKPAETKAAPEKPKPVERQVKIRSSRKDEVIRDEIITLYSELIGFDGVEVQYQWQVDRGDGAGWVDLEGATGPNHTYVANPVTVLYSWRLLVSVDD